MFLNICHRYVTMLSLHSAVITLVFHLPQTKNVEAISSISVCPSHPAPPKLA